MPYRQYGLEPIKSYRVKRDMPWNIFYGDLINRSGFTEEEFAKYNPGAVEGLKSTWEQAQKTRTEQQYAGNLYFKDWIDAQDQQQALQMMEERGWTPLGVEQVSGLPPTSTTTTTNTTNQTNMAETTTPNISEMTAKYLGDTSGMTATEKKAAYKSALARAQADLAKLKDVLSTATKAGITGSQEIPDWMWEGVELSPSFAWPQTDVTPYEGALGGVDASLASGNALMKQYEQNLATINTQLAGLQESQNKWYKNIMGSPNVGQMRADLYDQYGITGKEQELEADMAAIMQKRQAYNNKLAALELAKSAERERLAPMEFIHARMDRMTRDTNIELSRMAAEIKMDTAMLEFKQGRLDKAYQFIDQAVKDYTYEREFQVNMMRDFYEMNYNLLQDLTSDQKSVLDKAFQLNVMQLEWERQDYRDKAKLLTELGENGISVDGNAFMNLPYEQAVAKYASLTGKAGPGTDWELRTVGDKLYRVDPNTGKLELLAEDVNDKDSAMESLRYDLKNTSISYKDALQLYPELSVDKINDEFIAAGRANEISLPPGEVHGGTIEYDDEGNSIFRPYPTQAVIDEAKAEAEREGALKEFISQQNLLKRMQIRAGQTLNRFAGWLTGTPE